MAVPFTKMYGPATGMGVRMASTEPVIAPYYLGFDSPEHRMIWVPDNLGRPSSFCPMLTREACLNNANCYKV